MEIRLSVRGLVEFLLRSGDIDNRIHAVSADAMQEGSRIHRMIQKSMGPDYHAEVSLSYKKSFDKYDLIIEGRADGILDKFFGKVPRTSDISSESKKTTNSMPGGSIAANTMPGGDIPTGLFLSESVPKITIPGDYIPMIDEIKGTYRELARMREAVPVHLAQAKCYAAMYLMDNAYKRISVRLSYCNMDTEEKRYFDAVYTDDEILAWFDELIMKYKKWGDFECEWNSIRTDSIKKTAFPFPYREGQKDLAAAVYRTIVHQKKLFLQAPTGTGKTISTVFPTVKAMGEGKLSRIFYLTAKTITRTVAEEAFETLRKSQGLRMKTVTITARDKACFLGEEQRDCNPVVCPYAKGHFDRINDAIFDLMTNEDSFDREKIAEYARRYTVCPFEMALDMSLVSDAIICDYNYVFDPFVYLRRFFVDGNRHDYCFLVDETHNLLDRGRDMYSAALKKESFLELKRIIKEYHPRIASHLDKCNKSLLELKRAINEKSYGSLSHTDTSGKTLREAKSGINASNQLIESQLNDTGKIIPDQKSVIGASNQRIETNSNTQNNTLPTGSRGYENYRLYESIDSFIQPLERLSSIISAYLEDHDQGPMREEILQFYFDISRFLTIYDLVDDHYVIYGENDDAGGFLLRLSCVDPSVNLSRCMAKGISTILFSATLLPVQYYKKLLGGTPEDFEIYARSVFDPTRLGIFIGNDVTSRYSMRSDAMYRKVAVYIDGVIRAKRGNYLVFFPSHQFLDEVRTVFEDEFLEGDDTELLVQSNFMSEEARESFLDRFSAGNNIDLSGLINMDIEITEDKSVLGFCVMGGIFSEGIDLKNDSLIGVIIVGTGLPMVCNEREILRTYFEGKGVDGFDYAYRYPGMNKVLQAAGRVIRTESDLGVAILLDDRFLGYGYKSLFPREWRGYKTVTTNTVKNEISRFYSGFQN